MPARKALITIQFSLPETGVRDLSKEGGQNEKQVSCLVGSSIGCYAVSSFSLAGLCDFARHSPSWTLTQGKNRNQEFCLPSALRDLELKNWHEYSPKITEKDGAIRAQPNGLQKSVTGDLVPNPRISSNKSLYN